MAGRQSRRERIEDDLLAFELIERRWYLLLTVVLVLATAASTLLHATWPIPTGTGSMAGLSGLMARLIRSNGSSLP
jgi:hypothetical protein